MTIQRLQDQSKALTEVITLFSKEAKIYAQDIPKLVSRLIKKPSNIRF